MAEHLHQAHSNSFSHHEFHLALAMSEQPIDESEIQACPFYPVEKSPGKLRTHIIEHLEAIAFFVLPSDIDGSTSGPIGAINELSEL